ncbi:pilus assembly protein [Isoptericola sp. b490]|uniref:pilus assembly protein n=1 Tax=Actinotalea lenta TaxID=3064654 RepID=UPI0027139487|nr:pilus assembly protein [Isoptericola sp. b490]MDO8121197.1 pilus assembly protein [Isoptericola sp. b490]
MRALRARLRHLQETSREDGTAVVEFLGTAVVLLVPTVYLVLVLGRLQAAAFAVDGAAREGVRAALVAGENDRDPELSAAAAVRIALGDQGVGGDDVLTLTCAPRCDRPGATVTARVALVVDLPLVPVFVRDRMTLGFPVSAVASGRVDDFVDAG